MRYFPGVPWREWPDMPYEIVMGCISLIDGNSDDGEE